jgi:hypothetical protein
METGPPEKRLDVAPFAVQATRGLLRDPKARRKVMTLLLVVALGLVVLGTFGRKSWLEPHQYPMRFILFWFACGWVTLTALLLALLDLLSVRAQAKRVRHGLREQVAGSSRITPPE